MSKHSINISTISLIHTSNISDIQENIIMIRYNGRAVVRIIFMLLIPLGLLVWMRLMVLMMMLMMILMMVGEGTCILPKFPAAAVNIFGANDKNKSARTEHRHLAPRL